MKKPKGKLIRDKNGRLTNHQIWFKNWFNPILRKIGLVIVSSFDKENENFMGYNIRRYPFNQI